MSVQLKTIPDYSKMSIDDALKYRGSADQSEERAQKHDHVASIYNHVRINTCPPIDKTYFCDWLLTVTFIDDSLTCYATDCDAAEGYL